MKVFNNKPVYMLRYHPELGDAACLQNMWELRYPQSKIALLNADAKQFKKDLAKIAYTPKPKEVLYFGKSSKYPRYKLSASTYKRCIKLDKADCVVVGDLKYDLGHYGNITWANVVLEDEVGIYVIPERACTDNWWIREQKGKKEFTKNPSKYISDNNLFYGSEIKVLFDDPVNRISICIFNNDVYGEDISNVINGVYTKIIFDSELDKLVNSSLDALSSDDVESICDMLDSTDSSVQGMGLKMLTSFDISKTPLTVRIMLSLRPNLQSCSEWNSVGVKQVRETVKFNNFASFPNGMYGVFPSGAKLSDFPPEDIELCKPILIKATNDWIQKDVMRTAKYNTFQAIFPKIK